MLRDKIIAKIIPAQAWLNRNVDKFITRNLLTSKCPKILVVSIHKSGTHLIKRILILAGLEPIQVSENYTIKDLYLLGPKQFLISHYTPTEKIYSLIEQEKVKAIFNFRDPRDVCVSRFNWIYPNNKKNNSSIGKYIRKMYRHLSDKQLLDLIINGDNYMKQSVSVNDMFRLSRGLLFHPKVLKIKYEDLVGRKGGGNNKKQFNIIKKLLIFLDIKTNPRQIAAKAYSPIPKTFHKGKIGSYKQVFTRQQIKLFSKLHQDILKDYDYV